MPLPQQHTIRLFRGDSWAALAVRWSDSEGEPIEIASARMQVRSSADSTDVLITLDEEDGVDLDDNLIAPFLTPEQTADLTSGVYDIQATSAAGQVRTLLAGDLIVAKDVTRG